MPCGFENIKEAVKYALTKFYVNDYELLDYNTTDPAVSERCISFHIGWYLLDYVRDNGKDYDVDCEYNRHGMGGKQLREAPDSSKFVNCIPDIVIHKRKEDSYNFLVIEIKKESNAEWTSDFNKLTQFTKKREKTSAQCEGGTQCEKDKDLYGYSFGLHLVLGKEKAYLYFYEEGRVKKAMTFLKESGRIDEDSALLKKYNTLYNAWCDLNS